MKIKGINLRFPFSNNFLLHSNTLILLSTILL